MSEPSRRARLRELRGLNIRARAKSGDNVLLLTPIGGLNRRSTTPMNVAGYERVDGVARLLYVLPLDARRLTDLPPEADDKRLFAELWYSIDEAVDADDGPGILWQPRVGVGQSYGPSDPPWVELQKPRPWLEIGALHGGLRVLIPCTSRAANHPRLQAPILAEDLVISDPLALEPIDMAAELAHFAILRPVVCGWRPCGELLDPSIDDVKDGFLNWPQRQQGLVAY